jgi:superfamily II DNA/RNA helicase
MILTFLDLCKLVIKLLPQDIQFVFLSVSMAGDIVKTAKGLSHPSRSLTIVGENSAPITPIHVRQFYVAVGKEKMKVDRLCDLLEKVTFNQAIIFCNTRRQVDWLLEQLKSRDITVSAMVSILF